MVFLWILPISCGEGSKKTKATAGELVTSHPVVSISCNKGNFDVKVKSPPGTVSVDPKNLNIGDAVEISGSTGGATFSCKGKVGIDSNRMFYCDSSAISSVGTVRKTQFQIWANASKGYASVATDQRVLSFACL